MTRNCFLGSVSGKMSTYADCARFWVSNDQHVGVGAHHLARVCKKQQNLDEKDVGT